MGLKTWIKNKIYIFLDGYMAQSKERNIVFISSMFKHIGKGGHIDSPLRYTGLEHVSVGDNVVLGRDWRIESFNKHNKQTFTSSIQIGNNVSIEPYFHIGAIGNISIGNNVLIASRVFISDHSHGNSSCPEDYLLPPAIRPLYSKGDIVIGDNVWIGEGVSILSGVTIGDNSIIGAHSVVTSNIPANVIAAGIPAKVIRMIEKTT